MIIVSITTIPKRLNYLDRVLPILLNQTLKYDKLVINLDNNLTSEEYKAYDKLAERDPRIELYKDCDPKWRSANKLLPTIQRYPDAVVITMDDDLEYPLKSYTTNGRTTRTVSSVKRSIRPFTETVSLSI